MTIESWLLLSVLGLSIVAFASDRVGIDIISVSALLALTVTGVIPASDAFAGFASPAVITVAAVFVISQAVVDSGIAVTLGRWMVTASNASAQRFLILLMVTVALMSAVMNNIGAVAIMMPAVVTGARMLKQSPSKFLMPLAFASLIGGNLTLIGTPPNLLGSALLAESGLAPFEMLDFLPTGVLILVGGVVFMGLVGARFVPVRVAAGDIVEDFEATEFIGEFHVSASSPLIDVPLHALDLSAKHGLSILQVDRLGAASIQGDFVLKADDVVLVEGSDESLSKAETLGLVSHGLRHASKQGITLEGYSLMQVVLKARTALTGSSLKDVAFREKYGVSVVAIRHANLLQLTRIRDVLLAAGDTLLLDGPESNLEQFRNNREFIVLESQALPIVTHRRLTILILGVTLLTIVSGLFPAAVGMSLGAVAMVICKCVQPQRIYESIDWPIVVLIGAFLPIGAALETTGTARVLTEQLLQWIGTPTPHAMLALLFVITAVLTNVISNTAATVLIVPLAIDLAFKLNVSPHPFAMGTIMAASTSFLTPIAHQVNVLVMSAGGYKFTDYFRAGIWLNIIVFAIAILAIPMIWPF